MTKDSMILSAMFNCWSCFQFRSLLSPSRYQITDLSELVDVSGTKLSWYSFY
jgi:hypothetical protein